MAKLLTIDRGNTTTKLAVWDSAESPEPFLTCTLVNAATDDIAAAIDGLDISSAIVCSVAGDFTGLEDMLGRRGIKVLKLGLSYRLPITIGYETPETLGADRIAAVSGAAACYPGQEVLVVDIGTAVTYDRLTSAGEFAGGNIAPGIGMRLKALNSYTSALPRISSQGERGLWGATTETAMRNGAINGVIAEIIYYRSFMPQEALTVITGGWGADIAAELPFRAIVNPLLVMHGLKRILTYNENN